jgi:hypothetical protein
MVTYIRTLPKTLMRKYAAAWQELPAPRLQLRWAPKPVPNSDPQRAKDIRFGRRISRQMGYDYTPDQAWDCFYEMVLPVGKYDIRNEHYEAGFIIVPIGHTRRTSSPEYPPCSRSPTDDVWRDGAHAFIDSKSLGWMPIFVIAPDGTPARKVGYHDEPKEWQALRKEAA